MVPKHSLLKCFTLTFTRHKSSKFEGSGPCLLYYYSVSKSESSLSSEVRNYDHHRWETNKQMRETNTPCVPFDVFLFYHWQRCERVDHMHHRGSKECVANRFFPGTYFAGLFRAVQGQCRPLAASQVNRRKDMEVLHKFAQP